MGTHRVAKIAATMNFAVLASGFGSNLQAIIEATRRGKIKAHLALVLSDNKKAYALKRARRARINCVYVNPARFSSREEFEREIIKYLKAANVDFIVLAGFMRILSPFLVGKYQGRILNIHPALLPSFRGTHAIQDAFAHGVKVTGVSVHFVDEKVDHGPLILQEAVPITSRDTLKTFEAKIHKVEHRLYPQAIDLFARGKLKVKGRKVEIGR